MLKEKFVANVLLSTISYLISVNISIYDQNYRLFLWRAKDEKSHEVETSPTKLFSDSNINLFQFIVSLRVY